MHFDRDLHAVIGGEFAVLLPVGRDLLVPLPCQQVKVFRRPRTRHPVRILRFVAVAGATGKIDHDRHFELFRQQHRLAAHILVFLRHCCVGVQGIAVRTQRADGKSIVVELLFELFQRCLILQQRQLTVRVARIISRAELERGNTEAFQLLHDVVNRQVR